MCGKHTELDYKTVTEPVGCAPRRQSVWPLGEQVARPQAQRQPAVATPRVCSQHPFPCVCVGRVSRPQPHHGASEVTLRTPALGGSYVKTPRGWVLDLDLSTSGKCVCGWLEEVTVTLLRPRHQKLQAEAAALLLSLWPSSTYDFYSPGAHFRVSFKRASHGDWQHDCWMAAGTPPPSPGSFPKRGQGLGADPKGPHGALR